MAEKGNRDSCWDRLRKMCAIRFSRDALAVRLKGRKRSLYLWIELFYIKYLFLRVNMLNVIVYFLYRLNPSTYLTKQGCWTLVSQLRQSRKSCFFSLSQDAWAGKPSMGWISAHGSPLDWALLCSAQTKQPYMVALLPSTLHSRGEVALCMLESEPGEHGNLDD